MKKKGVLLVVCLVIVGALAVNPTLASQVGQIFQDVSASIGSLFGKRACQLAYALFHLGLCALLVVLAHGEKLKVFRNLILLLIQLLKGKLYAFEARVVVVQRALGS